MNPANGMWWCHAAEHGSGGKVDVGLPLTGRGHAVLHQLAADPPLVWHEMELPRWQPLTKVAKRYLARRGIDEAQTSQLGIVEQVDRMRVVVPYFGPAGSTIYWTSRAYSAAEEGPKYVAASGRHPLYVVPSWQPVETAIVVEGVFDAVAAAQHTGHTSIALGGKSLPRYLVADLLNICHARVVLVLDADALGSALKVRRVLASKREVTVVPLPDGEDPSSLGVNLKELLAPHLNL